MDNNKRTSSDTQDFYLRAEKIDIPTGFDIYPMTTDNGKSIAVIQPTEKAKQQQEQIAPLTHTDQGLRQILGGNTDYCKLDGDYATGVQKRPRTALFTPHNSGRPTPEGELDDWRLTIIDRQGQEQEQLQENPKQLSRRELDWRNQIQKKDNTYTQRNTKDNTSKTGLTTTTTNGDTTDKKNKDATTSSTKCMQTQSCTF